MKSKSLRISLVIPAYNEERHIRSCLDAIAAQTLKPFEVIVVDNNSTDKTAEIASSYDFVKVIHEPKQGIVFARNTGFAAATGTVIARTDADVILPKGWIEYNYKFYKAEGHAQTGLTGGGQPYNLRFARLLGWLQGQIAFRVNRLLLGHYIFFGSNMALPTSMWQAVQADLCYRDDIHEDLDLAIHAHRAGYKIAYHEGLRVVGRAGRVVANRRALWGYLMKWPQTLRVHGIWTWIFGWLGAIVLYVFSPLPWVWERLARLFGLPPLPQD